MNRLFFPTCITLICFISCIFLGGWQIKRLLWKNELISRIEQGIANPAVDIAKVKSSADPIYTKVSVQGKADFSKEMHFGQYYDNQWGYKIITPVTTNDGTNIFVNLGWVPEAYKAYEKHKQAFPTSVNITGIVLQANRKAMFAPDNNPEKNFWFWYDLSAMESYSGIKSEPFIVEVINATWPEKFVKTPSGKPELLNDHLQYAITWFLLAIAVAVIFTIYRRQVIAPKG